MTRQPVAPIRLLVVLNSGGDLDAIMPILARRDPRFRIALCASKRFATLDGAALDEVRRLGHPVEVVTPFARKWLRRPWLARHDALLTATESTLPIHSFTHRVTERANARKMWAYTLQQGLENVGVTYFDDKHDEAVRFAARRVLIWGPVENLPARTPPPTAAKCVAVGVTRPGPPLGWPKSREATGRPMIAVFENLHWHRYGEAYREAFIAALGATAAAMPDADFVLKPHPKSKWSGAFAARLPQNVRLAGDAERLIGLQLVAAADKVITTPSTVALDAARAGVPVAVVGLDIDVGYYEPLPILNTAENWLGFASREQAGESLEAFRARVLTPGDAAKRILDLIAEDVRQGRPRTSAQ